MRYKLTDENGQTYGGYEWGPGVSHSAPGTGELCSDGWIYVYDSPCVAVMMNPCHADFENPRLWECEVSGKELDDHGLKRGVQKCMTVQEIPVPVLTTEQRVEIAIRCALRVWSNVDFTRWAERWLDGTDRSAAAAWAAWMAISEETIWLDTSALEVAVGAAWGATCCGWVLETAASKAVWAAASKAVWAAALNAEIDITAVIEGVVENDRNAQIIEEGKCVTN